MERIIIEIPEEKKIAFRQKLLTEKNRKNRSMKSFLESKIDEYLAETGNPGADNDFFDDE